MDQLGSRAGSSRSCAQPPAEEVRDEHDPRADGERLGGVPLDLLDVLVQGERVVGIRGVGGDVRPGAVDLDLRVNVDCQTWIVAPPSSSPERLDTGERAVDIRADPGPGEDTWEDRRGASFGRS
jgi:hypothetical protein